jgi:hypothetical protein
MTTVPFGLRWRFAERLRAGHPGLVGLVLALALAGCAHYQLGTGASVKFATLFVAPVKETTLVPQARVLVTTQVREALLRDGRVSLVESPDNADAVLQLTLTGYDRTVAVAQPSDTGLARRFDLSLRATATLTDRRTKVDYFKDRPLAAKRGVFVDSGLVPAEYQTLPLLAEQMAAATVHAVLDVW